MTTTKQAKTKKTIADVIPALSTVKEFDGVPLNDRPLIASAALFWINDQYLFKWVDGETEYSKFVSPTSVRGAFANEPLDSGWLPNGVIRTGTTTKGDFEIMFLPAHTEHLVFQNCKWFKDAPSGAQNVTIECMLPSIFFMGVGPEYRLFAAREEFFNPDMKLYAMPLPNVDTVGHICWGQRQPPRAGKGAIATAWSIFCTNPFTDHSARDKDTKYPGDVRERWALWPSADRAEYMTPINWSPNTAINSFMSPYGI